MSPILVRPVREQLEHDRVIRLLQVRLKRKGEVVANIGESQTVPVRVGQVQVFPDLVLTTADRAHKLMGTVEVETAESVNHLEAMAQWAHLGRARAPFHLYVPAGSVEIARRLASENQVNVAEIWSFHTIGDQTRFTLVHRNAPEVKRPAAEPRRGGGQAAGGRSREPRPPSGRPPRRARPPRRRRKTASRPARAARSAAEAGPRTEEEVVLPYLRFSRDKRGYEHTFVIHSDRRRGRSRTRILYWFRTPPGVKVGRSALDEIAIRSIEEQQPGHRVRLDADPEGAGRAGRRPAARAAPGAVRAAERAPSPRRRAARLRTAPATRAAAPPRRPSRRQRPAGSAGARPSSPRPPTADSAHRRAGVPATAPRRARVDEPPPRDRRATPAHARLGAEGVLRLQGAPRGNPARGSPNASPEPARQDELKAQAERLNPDTWVTDDEVRVGLEELRVGAGVAPGGRRAGPPPPPARSGPPRRRGRRAGGVPGRRAVLPRTPRHGRRQSRRTQDDDAGAGGGAGIISLCKSQIPDALSG